MAELTRQDQLSLSDLKQMWGALENISYMLTEMALWLAPGRYREGFERALGSLVPVEWAVARRVGSIRAQAPGYQVHER